MDKSFRQDAMQKINQDALKYSSLATLDREYTLYEIAIMTRRTGAKPGLVDRGHLGVGPTPTSRLRRQSRREAMFATPELLFRTAS